MSKNSHKRIRIIVIILILLAAAGGVVFAIHTQRLRINPLFITKTDTVGADIARYQGNVDMAALKQEGIAFVYIKASEGRDHVDIRFQENWEHAKEAELPAGAYHFFSFSSSGREQALHYIDTVGDIRGQLIPAVDVEFFGKSKEDAPKSDDVRRELTDYLDTIEEAYGVRPMIYTRPEFYRDYLRDGFEDCRLWISSLHYPVFLTFRGSWTVWQYSDHGELSGISEGVPYADLNVLHKGTSLEELTVKEE